MASLSVDRPPPSSASSLTLNLSRLSLSPPIVSFPSSPTLPLNPLSLPTRRILTPIHALPKPNILLFPKKTKFRKQHRGKMKGKASRGNQISFGKFALQSLDCSWITARQLRAARMVLARYVKRFEGRGGKIWVRIFPDKSVTMRPSETRMGSGKGSPEFWVAVVKRDRIIFEIDGVPERVAREALTMAAFKLPIKTRFLVAEDEEEKKMIPAQSPLCSGGLPDVKPTAPVGV